VFPTAQFVRIDHEGLPDLELAGAQFETGTTAESTAWRELADLTPAALPAEGYALRITRAPQGARVVIAAADAAGLRWARAKVAGLDDGPVPALSVRDWPTLPVRGLIEGFYGTPWSDDDRVAYFEFAERNALNMYVYAPKDDPLHRERWRELYDEEGLARLAPLVRSAHDHGVEFVYAIHPALSMRYSDDGDHAALIARAQQLWDVGVRSFALLFDDVEYTLADEDAGIFDGPGSAHGLTCARFARDFIDTHEGARPLLMVPTDYAGLQRSEYRDQLAATLPDGVIVWWTGADVVVGEVTRNDIDEAAAAFGRPLLLWDNFPVNDFDFGRLFLGPLHGRTTDLVHAPLLGITANPMVEATASRFALSAIAEWAWNPARYDEAAAARRALAQTGVQGLDALVAALSSWPPSASPSDEWAAALAAVANADGASREKLVELCLELAATAMPAGSLGREIAPWVEAAHLAAGAVMLALDDATTAGELAQALARFEGTQAKVLRPLISEFLSQAIERRS
jgi:hyaluronoglucosaminidase